MSSLNEAITIPNAIEAQDPSNFSFLREKGIEYIEQLGRNLWTNYNLSDSGIVFLESLIYGITDLENRIQLSTEDILTSKTNKEKNFKSQFHTAKEILTTAPVTELDYRKLFIDINGVRNVWLLKYDLPIYLKCMEDYNSATFPVLSFNPLPETELYKNTSFNIKGLYTILVDFDEYIFRLDGKKIPVNKIQIFNEIINRYHDNRNLCEELAELKMVCEKKIKICAKIQVKNEADEEWIDARILHLINEYFSPTIPSYSLEELIKKEIPVEEIFNGPILENGFLLNEDIQKAELKREVRLSDIINIIMSIPGVEYIEDIKIEQIGHTPNGETNCCSGNSSGKENDWVICIPEGYKVVLDNSFNLQYFKDYLPLSINPIVRDQYLSDFKKNQYITTLHKYEDLPMPIGEYIELENYWSLQNNIPEMYGVGENGLEANASDLRKIQAKQLKAYLLVIEQILAQYFSQLSYTRKLFSTQIKKKDSNYIPNTISGIQNIEEITGNILDYQNNVKAILSNIENFSSRRNDFLNHLLSRFAEQFSNYFLILNSKKRKSVLKKSIKIKNKFIDNYPKISRKRHIAFDYTKAPIWDTDNIHGIQNRLNYIIGLKDKTRRNLYTSNPKEEGMYAVESTMLLPTKNNKFASMFHDFHLIQNETHGNKYEWWVRINRYRFESVQYFDTIEEAYQDFEKIFIALQDGVLEYEQNSFNNNQFKLKDKNGVLIAESRNGNYDDNTCKRFINKIKTILENDAFKPCCFQFNFIDKKDENLQFSSCALPCVDNSCFSCNPIDFYSYKMTFVMPGWQGRFLDKNFRLWFENEVYENLPAHILPRFCWVGNQDLSDTDIDDNDMKLFQNAWKQYLIWKNDPNHNMGNYMSKAQNLLCKINHLNTVYEKGILYDCSQEEDLNVRSFILNQSTLGTQKN